MRFFLVVTNHYPDPLKFLLIAVIFHFFTRNLPSGVRSEEFSHYPTGHLSQHAPTARGRAVLQCVLSFNFTAKIAKSAKTLLP